VHIIDTNWIQRKAFIVQAGIYSARTQDAARPTAIWQSRNEDKDNQG